MRNRRIGLALVLSLVLHGLGLLALVLLARTSPPPERVKATPIQIIVLHDAPKRPPLVKPNAKSAPLPPKPLAQVTPKPTPPVAQAPKLVPPPPAQAPKPAPTHEVSADGSSSQVAQAPQPERQPGTASGSANALTSKDSPRALHMLPNPLSVAGPVEPEGNHGRTMHNTPEELPDPEAVAAAQAEDAKRKVDGWINGELATLRVENGIVDGYFQDMKHALEKEAAHPPLDPRHNFIGQLAQSWLDGAQNYARTGNPYGPGMAPEPHLMGGLASPMDRQAEQFQGSSAQQFQQTMQAGARLREFADGRFGGALLAIVEIRQNGQGKMISAALVQTSGNKLFDDFVMKSAPTAIASLPPPPEKGSGLHPDGIRSTWAFEGRVTYKKKLSEMNALKDGWYLAGMLPLSMLAGNFDEVTGTIEVVDLRHPEFTCKVRLLQVY